MASSGSTYKLVRSSGGYKIGLLWEITSQDKAKNTSTIKCTAQLISTGANYTISSSATKSGSFTIDGSTYSFTFSAALSGNQTKTIATKTVTVSHNANGARSVSMSMSASINVTLSGTYYGTITTDTISASLDSIPVYTLSTSAGTGSTITVNRTSSGYGGTGNLSNGAYLYNGDVLKITFGANSGYAISTHTVNGSSFTSGNSHTVSANVSVISKAVNSRTLSISAGTGSSITVNRTSSPVGGTGNLSNGATLYDGDVLKITFTPSTNYAINTHTVNGSTFTSGNSHTVSANVSVVSTAYVLASSVGAADANIGSTSTITVTKYNSSYYHSLQYSFGSLSGYITSSGGTSTSEVRFTNTSVAFTVPTTFYAQIPNAKTGKCTITCRTYSAASGGSQLGNSTTATFTATAASGNVSPTITGTVMDVNSTATSLTGDSSKLIRYISTARASATATAKQSATIKSLTINGTNKGAVTSAYTDFTNTTTTSYSFATTDSRGYTASKTVTPTMVNYVQLTCNPTLVRTSPTGSEVTLAITGNFFNGSFGAATNALTLKYRYKLSTSSSYSSYITIADAITSSSSTITIASGAYRTASPIVLDDELDYKNSYDFQIVATDGTSSVVLSTVTKSMTLMKGIPVFDWGDDDFKFNVKVGIDNQLVVTDNVYNIMPVTRGSSPSETTYHSYAWNDSVGNRLAQTECTMTTSGQLRLNMYVCGNHTQSNQFGGFYIFKEKDNTGNETMTYNANTGLLTAKSINATGSLTLGGQAVNPFFIVGQGRLASANTAMANTGTKRVTAFQSTTSMTTGKPMADGAITQWQWDGTNGYASQLYVPNNSASGSVQAMQYRGQSGSDSWGAWRTVIDNVTHTSYLGNTGTGSYNTIYVDTSNSATESAVYCQVGKLVFVKIKFYTKAAITSTVWLVSGLPKASGLFYGMISSNVTGAGSFAREVTRCYTPNNGTTINIDKPISVNLPASTDCYGYLVYIAA